MRGGRARLVDFENPEANDLLVARQLTVTSPSGKRIRPDLTVFLNGLPVAVIELKNPADVEADLGVAIEQLGHYKEVAPDLFVPNLALVVSDGLLTRVGSITSNHRPVHALASSRGRCANAAGADSGAVRAADCWSTTYRPASSSRRTNAARSPRKLLGTTSSVRCERCGRV